MSDYRFYCDECRRVGNEDDGIAAAGDPCPDEECSGTVHLLRESWPYVHDDETGMEYWHDGEFTRRQCHDGVGLVTEHHQSFDDFMTMFPNADFVQED